MTAVGEAGSGFGCGAVVVGVAPQPVTVIRVIRAARTASGFQRGFQPEAAGACVSAATLPDLPEMAWCWSFALAVGS